MATATKTTPRPRASAAAKMGADEKLLAERVAADNEQVVAEQVAATVLDIDRAEARDPADTEYMVTLRFNSPDMSGNIEFHIKLPKHDILNLLAGKTMWIRLPKSMSTHPMKEARFVYVQSLQELQVYGWPD